MTGEPAPNFTLKNTAKESISLSDYHGKTVILAFYPGAFTGVCDKEMCTFQENMAALNSANAEVIGISVDSPWANAAFSNKYDLNFDLLSDFDRRTTKDYDVFFEGLGGIEGYSCSNRAVFIVDAEGSIKYRWVAKPNPGVEPDYNEIKEFVKSL